MTKPLCKETLHTILQETSCKPEGAILRLMARYHFSITDAVSLRYQDVDLESGRLRFKNRWIRLDNDTIDELEFRMQLVEKLFPEDVKTGGGYMEMPDTGVPAISLDRAYLFFAEQRKPIGKDDSQRTQYTRERLPIPLAKFLLETAAAPHNVELSVKSLTEMHVRDLRNREASMEEIRRFLGYASLKKTVEVVKKMEQTKTGSRDFGSFAAGLEQAWKASRHTETGFK